MRKFKIERYIYVIHKSSSVIVGRPNGTNKIRIATSADVDNPKRVEFDVPKKENPVVSVKQPKWINYVKGVIHHYSRHPLSVLNILSSMMCDLNLFTL